jgi:type I restriction enzyme S subunit
MKTWQQVRLGLVALVNPPCARPPGGTLVTFISMADVSAEAKIITPQIRMFASVATGFTCFEEGDVLVAKITPCFENGKGALASDLKNGRGAGSTEFHVLRPKPEIDGRFLHWVSRTSYFRKAGENRMEGSAGQKRLPASYLKNVKINLPPLPEQRKIADILNTWDEALEKLDALIAAKDRRKQALMQQLLTGQKRVKGFAGKWRTQELGSVVKPISRPVPKPAEPFLAAGIRSHGKGVFLKQDFKPSEIALDELFQLRTDDLVVNITFAWEGALAIVPPEANGALVSHRFPAFLCEDGKAALGFIRHLIRTKHFVFLCGLSSPGGAGRNRVLSKTSFLKIAVSMPSFQEQTAIADILDSCDKELRLLRGQRATLDQQKRGLMQRLLTGRVRVHLEKESRHA